MLTEHFQGAVNVTSTHYMVFITDTDAVADRIIDSTEA
jgi:hypothetical protein